MTPADELCKHQAQRSYPLSLPLLVLQFLVTPLLSIHSFVNQSGEASGPNSAFLTPCPKTLAHEQVLLHEHKHICFQKCDSETVATPLFTSKSSLEKASRLFEREQPLSQHVQILTWIPKPWEEDNLRVFFVSRGLLQTTLA